MSVKYTYKNQGITISVGTGVPSHSAVAGDEYTDTSNGLKYTYITSWKCNNTQLITLTNTTPVTIPTAIGTSGVVTTYRNFSGGNVLFTSTSSQEIGNLATGNPTTFTLYDGEILCLESNNTKWLII